MLAACATEPVSLTPPPEYSAAVNGQCRVTVEGAVLEVGGRSASSSPSLGQVIRAEACSRSSIASLPITLHVEEASCRFGRRMDTQTPAVQSRIELTYTLNGSRSDSITDAAQVDGAGRPLCNTSFWPLVSSVMDQVENSL